MQNIQLMMRKINNKIFYYLYLLTNYLLEYNSRLQKCYYIHQKMKEKIRKSCNTNNFPRPRERNLTGLKKQEVPSIHQIQSKSKISHHNIYQHQIQPLPSDSNLTCKQDYSRDQLMKAFYKISESKQYIFPEDLTEFLMDENQQQFKKYEMIRSLDRENKGYITLQQFLQFYEEGIVANQNQEEIPIQFVERREWRTAVDDHFHFFEKLQDKQYCMYLARELKKLRDVNVNITSNK